MDQQVYTGTVKWFNDPKGFGFITCAAIGGDVFAHYTDIVSDDAHQTLQEGASVSFKLKYTHDNTPRAVVIKESK